MKIPLQHWTDLQIRENIQHTGFNYTEISILLSNIPLLSYTRSKQVL